MNSLRRLATDRAINGSSSGIGASSGGSEYNSADARFSTDAAVLGNTDDISLLTVIVTAAGAIALETAAPASASPGEERNAHRSLGDSRARIAGRAALVEAS